MSEKCSSGDLVELCLRSFPRGFFHLSVSFYHRHASQTILALVVYSGMNLVAWESSVTVKYCSDFFEGRERGAIWSHSREKPLVRAENFPKAFILDQFE